MAAIAGIAARDPVSSRELWGYGIWLFAGMVFGVPESFGGLTRVPWPALTDTIGHLEARWAPVGGVVTALMILIVLAAIRHPLARAAGRAARHGQAPAGSGPVAADLEDGELTAGGPVAAKTAGPVRAGARTAGPVRADARAAGSGLATGNAGSLPDGPGAMRRPGTAGLAPVLAYYPLALCAVAGGSLIALLDSSSYFLHGYVIYGLFAFFFVFIPNLAAVCLGRRIPFPTLARTVINLEHRWWPAGKIILIGLVVLMIHLAVARWPSLPLS
jgi:hypothetical protein